MMPKFLPRLDRTVDSMPMLDASGPLPDADGAIAGEGVDGARPRSAFAELMSTAEAGGTTTGTTPEVTTDGDPASAGDAVEPFAPSFDLPAFLQVLPRAGNEVATAAAREPGLAAAVRRLPTANARPEARAVDAPDIAIRLPSFLVPPKVEAPVRQSAGSGGTVADAAPVAVAEPAVRHAGKAIAPPDAAPVTTIASTTSTPRAATAALESALRRAAPPTPSKETPALTAATAPSTAVQAASALLDPLAQGVALPSTATPTHPLSSHATRHKPTDPSPISRKEPGLRAEAAGRGPREMLRLEPSALVNALQRPFESVMPRTDTTDRNGYAGRSAPGGVEMGAQTTSAVFGSPADAASSSPLGFIEQGDRQSQAQMVLRQSVGTEAWQDELSAQLAFLAEQGEGAEAVMKLAPEELGELEVRVEVRDGEAALQFGVANAEARQAVEAAQTKLRDLFTSQGMNVSQFSVFSNLSGNSQSSSSDGRGSRQAPRLVAGAEGELEVVIRPRRSVGVLDLYA